MKRVTSKDGTSIAYDKTGHGPALILVDGALCYRESGPNGSLAEQLAGDFTVYTYDRRGRGDSDENSPYAVEKEVEDIEALVIEAGGSAYLYGISSGAALALEASERLSSIKKLAVYEAPFVVDDSRKPVPNDYMDVLKDLLAADRRGAAVRHFMSKGVGLPAFVVAMMPLMPAWKKLKSVAHTLPKEQWQAQQIPTLVVVGGKSETWMKQGMRELADVLPNAKHHTLAGQTHIVKPQVLAPVLKDFFLGG